MKSKISEIEARIAQLEDEVEELEIGDPREATASDYFLLDVAESNLRKAKIELEEAIELSESPEDD